MHPRGIPRIAAELARGSYLASTRTMAHARSPALGHRLVLNLIFLVLGIVVIIAGAYNIESTTDSNSAVFQTSIAIMVAGGLSIALGLFGIMGALCRNSCMLVTYIVLLSLLVVVQCVLGGLALSYGESDDKISEFSRTIWMSMGEDTRNLFQE